MPAFLPEAPLISQELVNPIISHFALLAENSANVPKRLCFLVLEKKKPKTKRRKTTPKRKKKNNRSCSSHLNTVVIGWTEIPQNHWAIASNQTKLAALLHCGREPRPCAYWVFIFGWKGIPSVEWNSQARGSWIILCLYINTRTILFACWGNWMSKALK